MGTERVLGSLGGTLRSRGWWRGEEGLLGEVDGCFSQVEALGPAAGCALPLNRPESYDFPGSQFQDHCSCLHFPQFIPQCLWSTCLTPASGTRPGPGAVKGLLPPGSLCRPGEGVIGPVLGKAGTSHLLGGAAGWGPALVLPQRGLPGKLSQSYCLLHPDSSTSGRFFCVLNDRRGQPLRHSLLLPP